VYAYPSTWTEAQIEEHATKRAAKLEANRLAREARKAAKAAAARDEFLAANPAIAALMPRIDEFAQVSSFVADVLRKVERYGDLSARQIECVLSAVAELDAEAAAKAAAGPEPEPEPVVEGRRVIKGEVLTTKSQDTDYGTTYKMLVEEATGAKVWGTIPRAIYPGKGDRVRFTATVEASQDDPCFGFYSRPTKAEVVEEAEVACRQGS
jgi:hypothetical protein